MKAPYRLIQDNLSHETVECLEQLLEEARDGQVIGIVFAAMYKRRSYVVDAAGEAHRNPTWSLGMVRALDNHLVKKLNAQAD